MSKKSYIGFTTVFLCMLALYITILSFFEYINIQKKLSNSLLSDRALSVAFINDDVITKKELYNIIEKYPEITIYYEADCLGDISLFGFLGNTNIGVDSFVEGRFFTNADFFSGNKVAVMGQKISLLQLNGSTNLNYKIIGTITSSISNMIENTAFVNLDSMNIEYFNQLTIDSENTSILEKFLDEIKKNFDIHVYSENKNFIERYSFSDIDFEKTTKYTSTFFFLASLFLAILLIQSYKKEIKVKKTIGVKSAYIYYDLIKNISMLFLIVVIIFIAIYSIIYYKILLKIHLNFYFAETIWFSIIIFIFTNLIMYFYLNLQKWNSGL